MPIIPLAPTNLLPNAPAPALNREKQPTVNNAGVIAGIGNLAKATQAPMVDGKALAEPFKALGAVGSAIAQGGSVLSALAIKRKEAESDVQIAQADGEMQAESAKFDQWKLETNADPAAWDGEWQKRVTALQERIGQRTDLHEGAREQIGLRLTRFAGQSQAAVAAGAAKETFARAKSGFLATIDNAIESQDKARFDEATKTGEAKGYFYPHETEAYRQQFDRATIRKRKEAEADAMDTALNDVTTYAATQGEAPALKALDSGMFGSYASADAERLRSTIHQVSNARAAESMNSLADGVSSGAITSAARIDQLAENDPHLTPKVVDEAKRYLISRDAMAEKIDKETNGVRNAVELRRAVLDYNAKDDPTREKYFSLVRDIGSRVEQSMAGELTGELYKKYGLNPPKAPVRPEIQQNVSKSLDVIFDPKSGAIPWKFERVEMTDKGTPVIDKTTGKPKMIAYEDERAKQRAIDAQTKIEMQLADFYRESPEKAQSLPEVKKKLNELLPEGTRLGALNSLQRLLPNVKPLPKGDIGTGALFDVNNSLTLPTK